MTPQEQLTLLSGLALNGLIASGDSCSPEPQTAAITAIDLALALQGRLYGGLVADPETQATITVLDLLEMLENWRFLSDEARKDARVTAANEQISSAVRIEMLKSRLLR